MHLLQDPPAGPSLEVVLVRLERDCRFAHSQVEIQPGDPEHLVLDELIDGDAESASPFLIQRTSAAGRRAGSGGAAGVSGSLWLLFGEASLFHGKLHRNKHLMAWVNGQWRSDESCANWSLFRR